MTPVTFRTATRYLWPLLVLYSVYVLIEGHHKPGGGFVAGLMAAAAVGLCSLAFDVSVARRVLVAAPPHLVGIGLLTMGVSGAWGLASGEPFLTGVWTTIPWPGTGSLDVGTPLLFDAGIYLTVTGGVVTVLLTLAEERP